MTTSLQGYQLFLERLLEALTFKSQMLLNDLLFSECQLD